MSNESDPDSYTQCAAKHSILDYVDSNTLSDGECLTCVNGGGDVEGF